MMTPVSYDSNKPDMVFLVLTKCQKVGLICVKKTAELFNLATGVLSRFVRDIFKF
jgi:hypothetical protein